MDAWRDMPIPLINSSTRSIFLPLYGVPTYVVSSNGFFGEWLSSLVSVAHGIVPLLPQSQDDCSGTSSSQSNADLESTCWVESVDHVCDTSGLQVREPQNISCSPSCGIQTTNAGR